MQGGGAERKTDSVAYLRFHKVGVYLWDKAG